MDHVVLQRVRAVGRRARHLQLLYGLSWLVVAATAGALLLGLVDYWLRIQDFGLRWMISAALLLLVGGSFLRFAWPALARRYSDLELARRIELFYPRLEDRLSSAVAFLGQHEQDPTAGAPGLRRAVIHQAASLLEQIDLDNVTDSRVTRRGLLVAGGALLVSLAVCLGDLSSAALAARRLVQPWRELPWPRVNDLAFENPPTRMAIGEDFEVTLYDRHGRLPDAARIYYWMEGDAEQDARVREMKYGNGRLVHRMANVSRSFRYRAVGGDDDRMPWQMLEVVEPPRVTAVRLTVIPPAYTGWPAEDVRGQIRAIEGSRVAVRALANKPLRSALVRVKDPDVESAVRGRVTENRRGFILASDAAEPWTVRHSGSWWFQLQDTDGLAGGGSDRWELRAVADRPPAISQERPVEHTFATHAAVVLLRIVVKDDLAIHTIELRYSRSDRSQQEAVSIPLHRGPDEVPTAEVGGLSRDQPLGESRVVQYAWDLATLEDLAPGTQLTYHIVAADYKPQDSQSLARRLTVITPDELQERFAQRQSTIVARLAEGLQAQQVARTQTAALQIQLQQGGAVDKQEMDQLRSVELNQRHVQQRLVGEGDSVLALIAGLLDELESNRVGSMEVERRMRQLGELLQRLGREHLPTIGAQLVAARKAAQGTLPPEATFGDGDAPPAAPRPSRHGPAEQAEALAALTAAGTDQEAVIAALEEALGELAQWDSYRRFAREIAQLRRAQLQLQQDSEELAGRTRAVEFRDLPAQERADLLKGARQQRELARQLDRLQGQMQVVRDQLEEDEPLAAATLNEALDAAQRSAVSGQMRQSASGLEQNQVGRALDAQHEVQRGLAEMLDLLAGRRDQQLQRLVDKQRESAVELDRLLREQRELRRDLKDAGRIQDDQRRRRELKRLGRQQEDVALRAEREARRLKRLEAPQTSRHTARAAEAASDAAKAAGQDDHAQAARQAERAEKELDQAQQALAKEIEETEEDLVRQQLARLEQTLGGLLDQQQSILEETRRLDALRAVPAADNPATSPDDRADKPPGTEERSGALALVADLGPRQRLLVTETSALARQLSSAASFALALDGAAGDMRRAADYLDRHETGPPAQQAQADALDQLAQVRDALKPAANPSRPEGGSGDNEGDNQENGGNDDDGLRSVAELRLLRLMQQSLNRRTELIEQSRSTDGVLPAQQLQLLDQLAVQQGQLAELLFRMSQPPDEGPEDQLRGLPETPGDDVNDAADDLDAALKGSLEIVPPPDGRLPAPAEEVTP